MMSKVLRISGIAFCAVAGISASSVFAADLPPSPPRAPAAYVPVVAPVFNWTAFYIGGNVGAAWSQGKVSDSLGNSWSNSQQAVFTGGGQVGANYQVNWAVFGVEADFDWLANNHNSSNAIDTNIGAIQFSANNRWITTLAARFGVAADNWLFYAKGGGGLVGRTASTHYYADHRRFNMRLQQKKQRRLVGREGGQRAFCPPLDRRTWFLFSGFNAPKPSGAGFYSRRRLLLSWWYCWGL